MTGVPALLPLGSQIYSAEPYRQAARTMIEKLARIRDTHGVVLPELDLGGGHGAEPGHGIRLFRDIGDA